MLTNEEMFNKLQSDIEELKHHLNGQMHLYKTILNHEETAMFLGLKSSYLHKLCSQRKITYFQPRGKLKYYKRDCLEKYLLSNEIKSTDDRVQDYFDSRGE